MIFVYFSSIAWNLSSLEPHVSCFSTFHLSGQLHKHSHVLYFSELRIYLILHSNSEFLFAMSFNIVCHQDLKANTVDLFCNLHNIFVIVLLVTPSQTNRLNQTRFVDYGMQVYALHFTCCFFCT